jgi:hypothetical protein
MKDVWAEVDFEVVPHKDSDYKIKTWEEIANLIDEHIVLT